MIGLEGERASEPCIAVNVKRACNMQKCNERGDMTLKKARVMTPRQITGCCRVCGQPNDPQRHTIILGIYNNNIS
jgi:hypothetical protein